MFRTADPPAGRCWPTVSQRELLDAALGAGDEVHEAFAAWVARTDLDEVDAGSYRLLPLLYRNLSAHGVVHPWMERLRGVYRFHWAKNQLLFRTGAAALEALGRAGIATLVLKGAVLAERYYRDVGARPMQDVDMLVPVARAVEATSVLSSIGFDPQFVAHEVVNRAYHANALRNAHGQAIDLHWHVLQECCLPASDDDFWARSQPLDFRGAATRAQDPADLLLHVLVHGVRYNEVPPLRWIADAVTVIRAEADRLDWDRLVSQAGARALTVTVGHALGYLQRAGAAVPAAVVRRLEAVPRARWEEAEYALKTEPRVASLTGPLVMLWYRHGRMAGGGIARKLAGFPGFVQRRLRCATPYQVPLQLGLKAAGHARAVFEFGRSTAGRR